MALSRQRLLTLVYGDMETVRMVCTVQALSNHRMADAMYPKLPNTYVVQFYPLYLCFFLSMRNSLWT